MPKYLSAKKLGILPEERKALIAFITKKAEGQIISLNGRKHYYDQRYADITFDSTEHQCGTEGCIAGYVFAHACHIQGKQKLRGTLYASDYIDAAWSDSNGGILNKLYSFSTRKTLSFARRVVRQALQTGKVSWSKAP